MSLTGEALESTVALQNDAQRRELEQRRKRGLSWFYWVAALSMLNAIIELTHGTWSFIFGLSLTQIVDGLFMGANPDSDAFSFPALVLDAVIAGGIALLGYFAIKGHQSACIVGMVLYALDGVVFLTFGDPMAAAVHAFALWGMWRGLAAHRELAQMGSMSPAAAS
jgi:hypothetical protein